LLIVASCAPASRASRPLLFAMQCFPYCPIVTHLQCAVGQLPFEQRGGDGGDGRGGGGRGDGRGDGGMPPQNFK